MKIKITAFFCLICILASSFAGCGESSPVASTSNTYGTTAPNWTYEPIPPRFYDMEALEAAIKNKDESIASLTKDITEIYRPEVKLDGYSLGVVNVYKGILVYYFVPSEFAGENWLDSDEADDCVVTVYYNSGTDMKKWAVSFVGGVEWLDDETFYYGSENTIYFKYENKVCSVALPKTYEVDIGISKVIEMKTVLIGE